MDKQPVWNVFYENFNARRIEEFNIFKHFDFMNDVEKQYKKNKDNYDSFKHELERELMYHFWSKCEYEVIISGWPPHDDFHDRKVDIFKQVKLNFDVFAEYVWNWFKENYK